MARPDITLSIGADTGRIVRELRITIRHLTALADELEALDTQEPDMPATDALVEPDYDTPAHREA